MNNKQFSLLEKSESKHFDKVARDYDHNYGYHQPFTQYKLDKKVKIFTQMVKNSKVKTKNILEIGCGTGVYTKKVASFYKSSSIKAIDISKNVVKLAREHNNNPNIEYAVASAYSLPYKDESFDIVFGFYILHHLDNEMALKECLRVVKKGGVIYFCEPNILNPIVYIIKNTPFIKRIIGDSEYETAINPFTVTQLMSKFTHTKIIYSEFLPIWPFAILVEQISRIDRFMDKLVGKSFLKYISGTLHLCFKKK